MASSVKEVFLERARALMSETVCAIIVRFDQTGELSATDGAALAGMMQALSVMEVVRRLAHLNARLDGLEAGLKDVSRAVYSTGNP